MKSISDIVSGIMLQPTYPLTVDGIPMTYTRVVAVDADNPQHAEYVARGIVSQRLATCNDPIYDCQRCYIVNELTDGTFQFDSARPVLAMAKPPKREKRTRRRSANHEILNGCNEFAGMIDFRGDVDPELIPPAFRGHK